MKNDRITQGAFEQMSRERALEEIINERIIEPALDDRKVNREIKDLQQRAHIYKTRLIDIEEEERALTDKKIYLNECLNRCQQGYKELSRKLNK